MATASVSNRFWTTWYNLYVTGLGKGMNYTCTKFKRFFSRAFPQVQVSDRYNLWYTLNKTLWTNMEVVHRSLKMPSVSLSHLDTVSFQEPGRVIPIYDTVFSARVYCRDWRNIPAVVFCSCVEHSVCTLIYSAQSFISISRLLQR
jgi:hypothetical protein